MSSFEPSNRAHAVTTVREILCHSSGTFFFLWRASLDIGMPSKGSHRDSRGRRKQTFPWSRRLRGAAGSTSRRGASTSTLESASVPRSKWTPSTWPSTAKPRRIRSEDERRRAIQIERCGRRCRARSSSAKLRFLRRVLSRKVKFWRNYLRRFCHRLFTFDP